MNIFTPTENVPADCNTATGFKFNYYRSIPKDSNIVPMPNQHLIKVIVKSHYWNELLLTGEAKTSYDIQKIEGLNDNSYLKQVLNLRFLAPEITEAILNGTQPRDLTMAKLFSLKTLDWQEQKKYLNIPKVCH